jgi:hypothetical protein
MRDLKLGTRAIALAREAKKSSLERFDVQRKSAVVVLNSGEW